MSMECQIGNVVYVCGTKSIPMPYLKTLAMLNVLFLGYYSKGLATQQRCYRPKSCFSVFELINLIGENLCKKEINWATTNPQRQLKNR
jgi:hypothetical protein